MFDYLPPLLTTKTAAIVVVSMGIGLILSDGTRKHTAILAAGFSFAGIMLSVFASRGLV